MKKLVCHIPEFSKLRVLWIDPFSDVVYQYSKILSLTIVKVKVVKSSLWERWRPHIRDVATPPSL